MADEKKMSDLKDAIFDFCIRVLKGEGTQEEVKILPELLRSWFSLY
jgi:hypothetical protein